MYKFITIIFCLWLFSHQSNAQVQVSGKVVDTANFDFMTNTSITAIRANDSVLVNFTRAADDGTFTLTLPKQDNYIFLITHPTFATFITHKNIDKDEVDLGNLNLISKLTLLEDVVITAERAIVIKGDTTEYNADSFKVREYANVEELLKKLPGLEVDDKGNITAHGEKVQRMLVDGDEFFSDDPAVLSKMLQASAVDKVQVFDGKSEEAKFTGVDDGDRIKTINLKLKANAKQGYFGKVELGGGLPGYWENSAMINKFNDKRKISAFGIMSNTNKVGLGWNESSQYAGGSNAMSYDEESGAMSISNSSNNEDNLGGYGGSFGGQGLPKTWNGGVQYTDKFGEDLKSDISAGYRFNKNDISTIVNSRNQYILPDTQYYNNNNNERFNSTIAHNLNARTNIIIDSTTDIIIRASGATRQSISNSKSYSEYTDIYNNRINSSRSDKNTDGQSMNGNAEITFRKKLKKTGRTFTASLNGSMRDQQSTSDFISDNQFYTIGTNQYINQLKVDSAVSSTLNMRLTYTEPITDKIFLTTNASSNLNNNTSSNLSYDKDGDRQIFNDTFSSSYKFRVWTNSAGANLRFKYDNYSFSFGGNVGVADFLQSDLLTNNEYKYQYTNFFPRASFEIGKSHASNFRFNYNGATQQPTISQIQPLRNNNNPLNIQLGNPDLKQQFSHNFSLNFGKYQIMKERYFYGYMGLTLIDDALSTEQVINPAGVSTFRTINIDGNLNTYGYYGYSFKVKPLKTNISIDANYNISKNNNILNYVKTKTTNYSYGVRLRANYNKDTTIDFSYSINPTYNTNTSDQNSNVKTNFYSIRQNADMSYLLPNGIIIGTDIDWYIREKMDPNDINNNVFLWNAYISKSFLKDRSLVVKVTGNDMLNQNIGFSRYATNNNISETTYNNIRRYFMLSFTWNFNKSRALSGGAPSTESAESIESTGSDIEEASTDPDEYVEPK